MTAGEVHTCAVRADRTVVCWGAVNQGQMGRDGVPFSRTPLPVGWNEEP